jgi:hypothetical protein
MAAKLAVYCTVYMYSITVYTDFRKGTDTELCYRKNRHDLAEIALKNV